MATPDAGSEAAPDAAPDVAAAPVVGGKAEDAERGVDAVLDPNAIAESYYQLHLQPPSAWTLELDLRPYIEKF